MALVKVEILKRGRSGVQVGTKTVYPFELGIQTKSQALRWNEEGVKAQWYLSGAGDKKKYLGTLGIYALKGPEARQRVRRKLDKLFRRKKSR